MHLIKYSTLKEAVAYSHGTVRAKAQVAIQTAEQENTFSHTPLKLYTLTTRFVFTHST